MHFFTKSVNCKEYVQDIAKPIRTSLVLGMWKIKLFGFCSKSNGIAVGLNIVENVASQGLAYYGSAVATLWETKYDFFRRELYNNRLYIEFSVYFIIFLKKMPKMTAILLRPRWPNHLSTARCYEKGEKLQNLAAYIFLINSKTEKW